MDIYQELLDAGVLLFHHESDLYAKQTPISKNIVNNYYFITQVSTFISQIDGEIWYEIPFTYTPF